MEITETKQEQVVILSLKGRLDASTSKLLEEKFLDLINNNHEHRIVMDFQQLDYISSAGLRVLLMAAKILKPENGKLVLASLKEHLKEIFEITGFQGIFTIFNNKEEALKNFS